MTDRNDELARVYARIGAMRANLESNQVVTLEFGPEYDALVDRAAQALGVDLAEFKIGNNHLVGGNDLYLAEGFRARLDGLLGYLRSRMPSGVVQKIGFR